MDSDDEFELLTAEAAPPVPQKKLKRLKKAIRVSEDPPLLDQAESGRVDSSEFEALSLEEPNEPSRLGTGSESLGAECEANSDDLGGQGEMNSSLDGLGGEGELNSGFDGLGGEGEINSGLDVLGGEGEMDSGLDGLGGEGEMDSGLDGSGGGEDGSGAKRVLDFESVGDEFGEKGEDRNQEMPEESGDMRMEEEDKKRRSSDGFEEEKEKKKSKRAKSETAAAKGKRMTEKGRRDHLKQLHAESQRLLRETRDAAFKPVPLVQKPISSVLEKIRKRKLEVLQKCIGTEHSSVLEEAIEEPTGQTEMGCSADGVCMDGSNDNVEHSSGENVSSRMDVDEESKQTFRAPIDDTQELFSDSQTTGSKDDAPSSPLEEVFAPSILAMNLKLDSAPPVDVSSDEEDNNDKENIDPCSPGVADLPSSPIGDPVKAFVDDEAEEEDDSDHDLFRFEDSDEDDGDAAEINDMIATGYEERPIDSERRNELHQKWLEQQDASGTEKLMQKLKFGSKQKETKFLEEKDADGEIYSDGEEDADGEKDSDGEEDADGEINSDGEEDADGEKDANSTHMSLRQIKQTIPLMFTDKDDVYLSSDDDETETRLTKQCLSEKAEEQATFLSPAEDESSREVFGLIKKLNIVPDTKKSKTSSPFSNMLPVGGDRGISSKSSFLGWGSNHSLPSSRKHGLSTVRSIIFGRGSSSSRSTSSVSEDSSDTIQRENLPTKTTSAKTSNSKVKNRSQKLPTEAVATKDTLANTSAEAVTETDTSAEAVVSRIATSVDTSAEVVVGTDASAEAVVRTATSAEVVVRTATSSPSLLKILRQSSLHSKRCTEEIVIGQTQIESVLSSFNMGRKRNSLTVQANRRS